MTDIRIPKDALVLIGDGAKALFFRNRGSAMVPKLAIESVMEPAAAQAEATAMPGATPTLPDTRQAEERFAAEVAEHLYRRAHDNAFADLVVVAAPRVLGSLRKAMHKCVADRVRAELPKELTSHPVAEIERALSS